MVERLRQREDAGVGDRAGGRLETGHPAQGGGDADGAAGVRPHRDGHHAGRDRHRAAAAGPARHPGRVPRVAGRALQASVAGGTVSELVGGGLADDDGARLAQPAHAGGVLGRHVAGEVRRTHGHGQPGDVDEVLHPDGDAVQRPAVRAGRQLGVRRRRRGHGALGVHGDERAERRVPCGDRVQGPPGQLARRRPAGAQSGAQLRDGGQVAAHARGVRHGWLLSPDQTFGFAPQTFGPIVWGILRYARRQRQAPIPAGWESETRAED